jgi:hypothetical protein
MAPKTTPQAKENNTHNLLHHYTRGKNNAAAKTQWQKPQKNSKKQPPHQSLTET